MLPLPSVAATRPDANSNWTKVLMRRTMGRRRASLVLSDRTGANISRACSTMMAEKSRYAVKDVGRVALPSENRRAASNARVPALRISNGFNEFSRWLPTLGISQSCHNRRDAVYKSPGNQVKTRPC